MVHHALLIGVDYYKTQPLSGAVNDVQELKTYLTETIGSIKLRMLTATKSGDPNVTGPIEAQEDLPTKGNVRKALQALKDTAKPGDFVYIHFSGHGTRMPPGSNENGVSSLELVILDSDMDEACFWTSMLAPDMNYMVSNYVTVTFVLDCCFSGSVHRGENVRYIPYEPRFQLTSQPNEEAPMERGTHYRAYRDADMMSEFIIKHPDKYAFIAACAANEKSHENDFNNTGKVHGQLSYYLLEALKQGKGLERSVQEIYDRTCFGFKQRGLRQHPIIYGNERRPFFGGEMTRSNATEHNASYFQVFSEADNLFSIRAGRAHGISEGDQFALFPAEAPTPRPDPVLVQVSCVKDFTSKIKRIGSEASLDSEKWKATLRVQDALRQFPIRLPSSFVDTNEWLDELQRRSLTSTIGAYHQDAFISVELDGEEFKICDSHGRALPNTPNVEKSENSVIQVCNILEHLVRFHTVKNLRNLEATDDFERSFSAHVSINMRQFDGSEPIAIKEETKAELAFTNNGTEDIYISIYSLGPQWSISNVLKETYTKVPAKRHMGYPNFIRKRLQMFIPKQMKDQGHTSCDDTLKIFITSHPVSMYNLQMTKLEQYLLFNESPKRYSVGDDVSEKWSVRDFQFRTTVRT